MDAANCETQTVKIINPGSKTTIDKLEEDNFLSWKFQVLITLRGHGLHKFIEEDREIPPKILSTEEAHSSVNPAYEIWVRQDNLITTWFLSSMSKFLMSELLDCKTSYDIWVYLIARFSSKNVARALELKSKLDMMKKGNLELLFHENQESS